MPSPAAEEALALAVVPGREPARPRCLETSSAPEEAEQEAAVDREAAEVDSSVVEEEASWPAAHPRAGTGRLLRMPSVERRSLVE